MQVSICTTYIYQDWGEKRGKGTDTYSKHKITLVLSLLNNISIKNFKIPFSSQHSQTSHLEIICEQEHELEKKVGK